MAEEYYYDEDSHATLRSHQRSGERLALMASRIRTARYRRICRRILVYLFTLFMILAALGLIFYHVALRARSPHFELREVKVKNNIKHKNSKFAFASTTLVMDAAIENKNFGPFEVENGTVSILYGGDPVAESSIKAGQRVRARGTARMNLKVNLTTDDLSDCLMKNLTSDVNSGMLKLRSHGQLKGRVYLMKIVNTSKISVMDCNIWINVTENRIQNFAC